MAGITWADVFNGFVALWTAVLAGFTGYMALLASQALRVSVATGAEQKTTQSVQIALELDRTLRRDASMLAHRRMVGDTIARGTRNSAEMTPAQKEAMRNIINFFDTVGMLLRAGALDEGIIFHYFGRLSVFYWYSTNFHIVEMREHAKSRWNDFDGLNDKMVTYMQSKGHELPQVGSKLHKQILENEQGLGNMLYSATTLDHTTTFDQRRAAGQ